MCTGDLQSFSRSGVIAFIEKYGGICDHSVTHLTDYAVVGTMPGMAKMREIKKRGIKILYEHDLLYLIENPPPERDEPRKRSISADLE